MNRKMRSKLNNQAAKAQKEHRGRYREASKFFAEDQKDCDSCGLPVEAHEEVTLEIDGHTVDVLLKPSKESLN